MQQTTHIHTQHKQKTARIHNEGNRYIDAIDTKKYINSSRLELAKSLANDEVDKSGYNAVSQKLKELTDAKAQGDIPRMQGSLTIQYRYIYICFGAIYK